MNKILNAEQINQAIQKIKQSKEKIILAGGCFDILHDGHLSFLKELKKSGAVIILLESDENIKKRKGENRPVNNQKNRAFILSTCSDVDFIIPLKGVTKNEEYDKLIVQIKPDVIGITNGDKFIDQRRQQCKKINAKLLIIKKFKSFSTSDLISKI